jgi:hypothetical protein
LLLNFSTLSSKNWINDFILKGLDLNRLKIQL